MNESVLNRLHAVEQEILDEFVRICSRNGLRYYLIGGTLLGAVRHKGFIPWDDDLDVAMPRGDYLRFIGLAPKELDRRYFLQCYQTDPEWNRIFAKIRMNNTVFLENKTSHLSRHTGIFIDIFPLDEGFRHGRIYENLKSKYVKVVKAHIRMATGEIKMNGHHRFLSRFLPLSWFVSQRESWFRRRGNCYVNYGSNYGTVKQTMPIEWYEPVRTLEFEGKEYSVPGQYQKVLGQLYGPHYMDLPPPEKRVTHNPLKLCFDVAGEDRKTKEE